MAVAWTAPSHNLNQENAVENIVWKMSAILSRPKCVKKYIKSVSVFCRNSLLKAQFHVAYMYAWFFFHIIITKVIYIFMRQAWVSQLRRWWLPVHWSEDNGPTTCWVLGRWELQWRQITMGQFHWMSMSVRNMILLSGFKFHFYLNHWPMGLNKILNK